MKHAILVTAYKNIEQLRDLVQSLDDDFYFYIHIDKRSTISKLEIMDLQKLKNVHLVSQKYGVKWGGFNHLRAILHLLETAFGNAEISYFHLITGQDYPIKKAQDISRFLEQNKKEYIEYHKLPYDCWPEGGLDRLLYHNLYDLINGKAGLGRFLVLKIKKMEKFFGIKRKFAPNFPQLYGGGTYWTLSRSCIDYVLKYMEKDPSYLIRFKYTFCAEEIFFQTIILNSPLKNSVINNHLRFIVWDLSRDTFPANLDERDEDALMSSDAIFARKFELPVSSSLLNKIKKNIN